MLPGGVPLVGNFIPPGTFLMGGEERYDDTPVHKVAVTKGFFIGIYPVTQAQWRAVMNTDPSEFKGDNRPVEMVSWEDAAAFCVRATGLTGHRVCLPTGAIWEYACRAGTTTHFHFGDVPDIGRMNYDGSEVWNGSIEGAFREQTTDVGTFAPNPWGLFDWHGNVWEWCQDWYHLDSGTRSGEIDLVDREPVKEHRQEYRLLCGGSWINLARDCRAASRSGTGPNSSLEDCGFRVAFTLS